MTDGGRPESSGLSDTNAAAGGGQRTEFGADPRCPYCGDEVDQPCHSSEVACYRKRRSVGQVFKYTPMGRGRAYISCNICDEARFKSISACPVSCPSCR